MAIDEKTVEFMKEYIQGKMRVALEEEAKMGVLSWNVWASPTFHRTIVDLGYNVSKVDSQQNGIVLYYVPIGGQVHA